MGKSLIIILLLVGLFTVNSFFLLRVPNEKNELDNDPELETVYKQYCLGCHNDKKSSFVNRNWLFGRSRSDIYQSIKYGRPAHGMPAFDTGMSDKRMYDLADYIINLAEMVPLSEEKHYSKDGLEHSENLIFKVDTVLSGLDVPWGMAFLPTGDMLITERSGKLLMYKKSGKVMEIKGIPEVKAEGQGGLLDIKLHPDFENTGWVYFSYSSPSKKNPSKATTAIMRAHLKGNALIDQQVLFKANPEANTRHHYGSKLVFDRDGYLYFSVGDRGNRDVNPQDPFNDCGKIHRINDDGSIPEDNPFVKPDGTRSSVFSYGHRNPQGLCMNPETGEIWSDEHGPKGGDEINLIKPGKNYGWPVISFGINYSGTIFTHDTAKIGMEQPVSYWVPSIAPCGMTFVSGNKYPKWTNNILTGSLRFEYLKRVELDQYKVVHEENLLVNVGRVRNVEMSPDGYIYVAIEKPGKILKLVPL